MANLRPLKVGQDNPCFAQRKSSINRDHRCFILELVYPQTVYCWGSLLEKKELATVSGRTPEPCVEDLSSWCPPGDCSCPAVVLWPCWPTLSSSCPPGVLSLSPFCPLLAGSLHRKQKLPTVSGRAGKPYLDVLFFSSCQNLFGPLFLMFYLCFFALILRLASSPRVVLLSFWRCPPQLVSWCVVGSFCFPSLILLSFASFVVLLLSC